MKNKNKLYSYSIVSLLTLTTVLGLLYSNNVIATTAPRRIKFKFTTEEDNRLSELVELNVEENWPAIATNMPGRNARQCKERWLCYLNPTINRELWTQEEVDKLIKMEEMFPNRWAHIVTCFPNSTALNVRNKFIFLQRKRAREIKRLNKQVAAPVEAVALVVENQEDVNFFDFYDINY